MRLLTKLVVPVLLTLIVPALAASCARPQEERGGLEVQRGRDERVGARGKKTYYDKRWNLDDLPQYKPEQNVSGTIRVWGSGYFAQGNLGKYWEEGFRKYHPEIKFDYHLKAPALGIPALCVGMADIAPSRHITFDETLMFERVFSRDPIEITMVTGITRSVSSSTRTIRSRNLQSSSWMESLALSETVLTMVRPGVPTLHADPRKIFARGVSWG